MDNHNAIRIKKQVLKRSKRSRKHRTWYLIQHVNHYNFPGFVLPVCLPPADFSPRTVPSTKFAIAAGWGFTENGTSSNRIKHVNLPLVDNSKCNEIYRGTTVSEQVRTSKIIYTDKGYIFVGY